MRVLAADVGGTKTAVAIFEMGPGALTREREAVFPSGEHASFEEILGEFLSGERRPPRFAGIGVAGPVRGGSAKVTKLPWSIEERRLSRALPRLSVRLVNDFVAAALGIPYLKARHLATLARGKPERGGPIALLGAGTGLGEAGLLRVGGRYEPFASEGGHADFAARDAREDGLAEFLRRKFGRIDYDRVLSGEGLGHLYDFLKFEGFAPESETVARAFLEGDRAAAISRFALAGSDALCREALSLFVSIYGSEAGNAALRYRATGGVFVAGGIAPKILPALKTPSFLESFRAKPPLEELLRRIPVRVVLEPRLGLFGAAAAGYRMAIETTRPFSKRTTRLTAR